MITWSSSRKEGSGVTMWKYKPYPRYTADPLRYMPLLQGRLGPSMRITSIVSNPYDWHTSAVRIITPSSPVARLVGDCSIVPSESTKPSSHKAMSYGLEI